MRGRRWEPMALAGLAMVTGWSPSASAQTTAFTYQGELTSGGVLAQGRHDLWFRLTKEDGSPLTESLCADDVLVVDGRFTVVLDFGPEVGLQAAYLEIQVRPDDGRGCNDGSGLETLLPLVQLTPAPSANFARLAGTAQTLGGLPPSYFTNASNLSLGTLPDSVLSSNVPRLDGDNAFLGSNVFGNVAANGWIGSATGPVQLHANGQRVMLIQRDSGPARVTLGSATNSIALGAGGANILGGEGNRSDSIFGTIAGGSNNRLGTTSSDIAAAQFAFIGGGQSNQAQAPHAVVAGGRSNRVEALGGTVGGGYAHVVRARYGTIAGGGPWDPTAPLNSGNEVTDAFGTVGGGSDNRAGDNLGTTEDRPYATVGGGIGNVAEGARSTVAGGASNRADGEHASIGGGAINRTSGGGFATIAGGSQNQASGFVATIGGGDFNNVAGERAVVSGGNANVASGRLASIAGGVSNAASGEGASIAGGASNAASGAYSHVPGGLINQATGFTSLAAGWGARAVHDGAFVWADTAQSGALLQSTAANQFTVRASGGTRFLGTGNAPRLTIEPSGTVAVPGTLSAGEVAYATPRTRFRSYSAGAFVGSVQIPVRTGTWLEAVSGDADSRLHLPLDLPDGAVITGIRFTIRDVDPNRWMDLQLIRTSLTTGAATSVTSALTQAFFGNGIPVDLPVAPPIVVNNADSVLEILVEPKTNGLFGPFPDWSGNIAILGVRVQYTVTTPAP